MQLNSWGMYPQIKSKKFTFKTKDNLKDILKENSTFIPFGNGRSYGDSALAENIIYSKPYNYFLDFDEKLGILHCQSGVMLSEIIEAFVPRGWFLKVTPGTKLITIGGAIASDVHGKNHHVEGCFSSCVEEFTLILPNGEIKNVKKDDELFLATCGGMGLTGVILDAKISLKKINSKYINQTTIKTKNLKETFEAFEKYSHMPYSVAWIDCLASGEDIGKCLLMVGDFADDGKLDFKEKKKINIPFNFCTNKLNGWSINITEIIGVNNSKDFAMAGGTESGNFIVIFLFTRNLKISIDIKAQTIAVKSPLASRYLASIIGIQPEF